MNAWRYQQAVAVAAPGVVRFRLPLETAAQGQPALPDLRITDAAGQEVSFLVEQPAMVRAQEASLETMTQQMEKGKTVVSGRVPDPIRGQGLDRIYLYTPTDDFLKPVSLEASMDGKAWKTLVRNYPIFKQPGGGTSTSIAFGRGDWRFLRLTLDDASTPPIRVQAVTVVSAPQRVADRVTLTPTLSEPESDGQSTTWRLTLPVAHPMIESIRFETDEPTFRRPVRVSVKEFSNGEFRDSPLADGLIYRVALGKQAAEAIEVPVQRLAPGQQLSVRVDNGDSRPLAVRRITVSAVQAELLFSARVAGTYTLWIGNPAAPPRQYDVAQLGGDLQRLPSQNVRLGVLTPSGAFRQPDPLPQVADEGTDIDVAAWRFRKAVRSSAGAQAGHVYRLEPDAEALAHNDGRLRALRLVRNGKQVPYVLDLPGVSRELSVTIESIAADRPSQSRWRLTLPHAGLIVTQWRFTTSDPLFQRTLQLWEEAPDERGEKVRRLLGSAQWTRTNGDQKEAFTITTYQPPQTATLILETDNGDNPPLTLAGATSYYQAPRLLFKTSSLDGLYLYYGQPDIAAPQYDVSLIASELLAQVPSDTALGKEEVLKTTPWYEVPLESNISRWIFWGVMALVVAGLLLVIAKLLPAEVQS